PRRCLPGFHSRSNHAPGCKGSSDSEHIPKSETVPKIAYLCRSLAIMGRSLVIAEWSSDPDFGAQARLGARRELGHLGVHFLVGQGPRIIAELDPEGEGFFARPDLLAAEGR